MKIHKNHDVSILIRSFGLQNDLYLTVSPILFFDLTAPESLLTEQDLWKTVPDYLGDPPVLDQGLPKARGEVLIAGKCFPPRGTSLTATEAGFSVGHVRKKITVFGDRHWTRAAGVVPVITDPQPFSEMGIDWSNAFGGAEYPLNPLGKGIEPTMSGSGKQLVSLPNIEYPQRLIGAPTDRPAPAGFNPIDPMWPQRSKNRGTYGEQWLREHWPYFPADLNPDFFHTAADDQWAGGYFRGDEPVEIKGMHPDFPVIRSRLPGRRVRVFVTQRKSLKPGETDTAFKEVKTNLDTVWLFPTPLRAALIFRGSTLALDDEFADVAAIYLAVEDMSQEPLSIDHYYDLQQKALDRTVPIDRAPLEKAQKQIAGAIRKFKRIPKRLEDIKQKAMGRSPIMPMPEPAEMKALADRMTGQGLALISNLEAMARSMHRQHGHLVGIDLDQFDRHRAEVQKAQSKVDRAVQQIEQAHQKALGVKDTLSQEIKSHARAEDLKKAGLDPDDLAPARPVNPWHDRGFPLVVRWRRHLENNIEVRKVLHGLGLEDDTIRRAWMGYNPEPITEEAYNWGFDAAPPSEASSQVLPAGLVLPRFDGPVLNRLVILPPNFTDSHRETVALGSVDAPLFLPVPETGEAPPVVRVATELEAWFLEQEIGDAVGVMAMKSPDEIPDDRSAEAIEAAMAFLVVLPEESSEKEWPAWAAVFPQAQKAALPGEANLFSARQSGLDVRAWILSLLPKEFKEKHLFESILEESEGPAEVGFPAGLLSPGAEGIQEMINTLMNEIRGAYQAKFDLISAKTRETLSQFEEPLAKQGLDAATFPAGAPPGRKTPLSKTGEEMAGKIAERKARLRELGLLTPEADRQFSQIEADALEKSREGERRLQEGMDRIKAGQEKAAAARAQVRAGSIPDDFKQHFKDMDPERIRRRTREEVVEMHGQGRSLAGSDLSGLDLSGLDLSGLDLTEARCIKTNFSKSNLSEGKMIRTLARGADFSETVLQGAQLEKGLFARAKFVKSDLSRSRIRQAVFTKADLSGADLSEAHIIQPVFRKTILHGTVFGRASVDMGLFSGIEAKDADFSRARLIKCLFHKAELDQSHFGEAVLDSTMFQGCTGSAVKFTAANLDRARMAGQTRFPGADFTSATLRQACFRESDLSQADFQGAVLDEAMIESCDLSAANLKRVSAKACRLAKSNLEGADLSGINLFQGSLRKARLTAVNLRGSNLYGVDFYKAVLGETKLDLANLKRTFLENRTEYLK